MLTLPPVLGSLAKLTAKPGNPRYSVEGVSLKATDDGWEAVATDTTRCVVVAGKSPEVTPDTPPALVGAPNGATHAVVPAKWWADTFAAAKKTRGDNAVKVVMSTEMATAACGTLANGTPLVDGKFPPYQQFMLRRTDDLACVVRFDANRMIGVLKALIDTSDPADLPVVSLEVRRPNGPKASDKPIMLRVDHPADGVSEAHALVMPAGPCDENGQGTQFFAPADHPVSEELANSQATIEKANEWIERGEQANARLQEDIRQLTIEASRAKLAAADAAKVQANMRVEVAEWTARCAEHAAEVARLREMNPDLNELAGLWGRVGELERTTCDAHAESERLRAELDAVRCERDRLRADVEALRARPTTPAPAAVHHQPTGPLPTRRTLGQLAAARKGGA